MKSIQDSTDFRTPTYPFNASRREYERALEAIPSPDLLAEAEALQLLALDLASDTRPGGNRAVVEILLESRVPELERRKRLWQRSNGDPLRPQWPRRDADLKTRVDAVKAAWPIVRFCTDLLNTQLQRTGTGRWKAPCPLPGHDDKTPSFVVYESSNSAWCFGCDRGGDVIALTGFALSLERFYDRLEHLEHLAGIGNRGVA